MDTGQAETGRRGLCAHLLPPSHAQLNPTRAGDEGQGCWLLLLGHRGPPRPCTLFLPSWLLAETCVTRCPLSSTPPITLQGPTVPSCVVVHILHLRPLFLPLGLGQVCFILKSIYNYIKFLESVPPVLGVDPQKVPQWRDILVVGAGVSHGGP